MSTADPALVHAAEAARILGVERSTISYYVRSGKLKPVSEWQDKSRKRALFNRADVEALQQKPAPPEAEG